MSTVIYRSVLVSGFGERVEGIHAKAVEILGDVVSPMVECKAGWRLKTFVVGPHGCSDGGEAATEYNSQREAFIHHLRNVGHSDWVEVVYGGDLHTNPFVYQYRGDGK